MHCGHDIVIQEIGEAIPKTGAIEIINDRFVLMVDGVSYQFHITPGGDLEIAHANGIEFGVSNISGCTAIRIFKKRSC